MAPTGFHGLLGLWVASKLDQKHRYIRMGLVAGSVVPDLDLLGSVLIFLLTADKGLTTAFHRSVTHSLVVMAIILIIGYLTNLRFEIVHTILFPFVIGLIGGMLFHVTLDMFYLGGVTLFWPLQPLGERVTIVPFTYEELSPSHNSLMAKIIATLDGSFEIIFYWVFAILASKYNTSHEFSLGWKAKKISILNWPHKLRRISIFFAIIMVFFLLLAFLSIPWSVLDRDNFIILLYVPLTPMYLLSGLLPLLMRETIVHLGEESAH